MRRFSSVLSVALLAAAGFSCTTGRLRVEHASGEPTCDAVCDYYTACRNTEDPRIQRACVSECQEIFYEDGHPDARSLEQFQQLECSDAVAFVEGTSGRPPGTARSARATKTAREHEAKR